MVFHGISENKGQDRHPALSYFKSLFMPKITFDSSNNTSLQSGGRKDWETRRGRIDSKQEVCE
jgi:hypothetical protein